MADPDIDPTVTYVPTIGEAAAMGAAETLENLAPVLEAGARLRDSLSCQGGWSETVAEALAAQVTSSMIQGALSVGADGSLLARVYDAARKAVTPDP